MTGSPRMRRDETAMWKLRSLYENSGFRRCSVPKFEDYNLYADNKSFLATDNIITFMDLDGKLLALKPDVTLSIVKNMPQQALPMSEKLYYMDEVCRLARENREYKMLQQIGVECIGRYNPLSNLEVVTLALRSLALIGDSFVLDISHLGFVSGLFDSADCPPSLRSRILSAIHAKSTHEVRQILLENHIPEDKMAPLLKLADLHGPFHKALGQMKELICNEATQEAYKELSLLQQTLTKTGMSQGVFLDFSVVSDLDYYNGLVFLGYVKDVPRAVLTGGRYDNLMRRMGKDGCAIGFAVNLSALEQDACIEPEFHHLILYAADCDYAALLQSADSLRRQGQRVRLECQDYDIRTLPFHCEQISRFTNDNRLEEVASC